MTQKPLWCLNGRTVEMHATHMPMHAWPHGHMAITSRTAALLCDTSGGDGAIGHGTTKIHDPESWPSTDFKVSVSSKLLREANFRATAVESRPVLQPCAWRWELSLMSRQTQRKPPAQAHADGEAGHVDLFFTGIAAFFVETGIQPRRLQVCTPSLFLFLHLPWLSSAFWHPSHVCRFENPSSQFGHCGHSLPLKLTGDESSSCETT